MFLQRSHKWTIRKELKKSVFMKIHTETRGVPPPAEMTGVEGHASSAPPAVGTCRWKPSHRALVTAAGQPAPGTGQRRWHGGSGVWLLLNLTHDPIHAGGYPGSLRGDTDGVRGCAAAYMGAPETVPCRDPTCTVHSDSRPVVPNLSGTRDQCSCEHLVPDDLR